jgi:hypothetical protein
MTRGELYSILDKIGFNYKLEYDKIIINDTDIYLYRYENMSESHDCLFSLTIKKNNSLVILKIYEHTIVSPELKAKKVISVASFNNLIIKDKKEFIDYLISIGLNKLLIDYRFNKLKKIK